MHWDCMNYLEQCQYFTDNLEYKNYKKWTVSKIQMWQKGRKEKSQVEESGCEDKLPLYSCEHLWKVIRLKMKRALGIPQQNFPIYWSLREVDT